MVSKFFLPFSALLSLLVTLLGCGSVRVTFDPSAAAGIKKVAVLRLPEPGGYTVEAQPPSNSGATGGIIGATGGIIGAAIVSSVRSTEFTDKMQQQQFAPADRLSRTAAAMLTKRGCETIVLTLPRDVATSDALYAQVPPDVDAVLILEMRTIGYYIEPRGGYSTRVDANVRLLSTRTKAKLYLQAFSFGTPSRSDVEVLAPTRSFESFEALMLDPARAQKGLELATDEIVNQLGLHLSLSPPGPCHKP